ncbi:MAG: lysophospholipid acyltransferase family protein [Acidobacteriota bacterium]
MIKILKVLFHMFFRLFFTVEYYGVENVPKTGAVVLAGNHPSYFDPVLIYIAVERPVRFLAWDKLFTIPLLGAFLHAFGAIPVNVTKRDSNAFEQAMKVLEAGAPLGIFPEAGRSRRGIMEMLKTGAARLAIYNQCPIVPITITGAYEAWPVRRLLPLPRKITVKFHEPIQPDPKLCETRRNDPEFHEEITESFRASINQRLLPGLRAQEALNRHFARPAAPLRIFEMVPLGVLPVLFFTTASRWQLALPMLIYYTYLLLNIWVLKQGRITKVTRDLATPLLMLVWHPILIKEVSMPKVEFLSLALATIGIMLPYYWTNYYDTQRFLRGLVLAYYLGLALEIFKPAPFGLHWVIMAHTFFYSLYHRPLYWYCQIAFVLLYSVCIYRLFGTLAINELTAYLLLALIINAYMLLFKFTAHDGRVI